jgi:purine-nucleoside phosphorylase
MSIHIGAKQGEIAPVVLLPGDPLRAEFVAKTYFAEPACHSRVRGMLGFTGSYKGTRVSVQGTGMGIPSVSIYAHELVNEYGVRRLIRIGTCGAFRDDLEIGDVILAQAASTDSAFNTLRFGGRSFAPVASFALLAKAHAAAVRRGTRVHVGNVLTCDLFYMQDPDWWKLWARHGVLAAEMETAALYTIASSFGAEALSVLTVSDTIATGKSATTEQRQTGFTAMMEIALEAGTAP